MPQRSAHPPDQTTHRENTPAGSEKAMLYCPRVTCIDWETASGS